jgi:NAD(P)-dependent dehydrogenase (short-subunit alcohol dehydrogenase family)
MLDFNNKTVVLTGGSGGIGLITAETYLKQGARVVLFDLNAEALESAKNTLQGDVITVQGDVTRPEDLERLVEAAGEIDVLVCLTGLYIPVAIGDMQPELIDKVFNVNVKGTILSVQAAQKAMKPGSAIVVFSSSSHLKPIPEGSLYGASKGAVRCFARSAALELMEKGIRVNTVCPGPVDTERMAAPVPMPQEVKEMIAGMIPMKRLGLPQEIANAVLYLSSDEAAFVTGAELNVCGGLTNL